MSKERRGYNGRVVRVERAYRVRDPAHPHSDNFNRLQISSAAVDNCAQGGQRRDQVDATQE